MSNAHLGEFAALATAVLWTASSLCLTAAGKHIGALAVSFLRLVIAVVLFLICGALIGRGLPVDADAQAWLWLGTSGFVGFFLCDICLFKAMLLIGPRLTLLIFSLTPPIAAVMSLGIGDVLTFWDWAAMGVTLAGIVWVVVERPNGEDSFQALRHRRRGVALGMFAAVTSAAATVLSKQGMIYYHDPMAATLIRALAALVGYVGLITLRHRWPAMVAAARHRRAMTFLLPGGVLGPFLGMTLFLTALQYSPTGVVATITATMPVMVLPFSVFVHHEKITWRAVVGALVAVSGVALLMLGR